MDRRALIDERIRNLLISTDLTFKQIIEKLRAENISASFNTIRRVNRNHRYRKPRYDAKLTPQQRKQLVVELKNTSKPNLSALARKYGVCHGSVWYWWDKLSKIREKNNGIVPSDEPSLDFDDMVDQEFMSPNDERSIFMKSQNNIANYDYDQDDELIADPESDPLDLSEEEGRLPGKKRKNLESFLIDDGNISDGCDVEMVGSVKAKDWAGKFIDLPILMYAPVANESPIRQKVASKFIGSGASSSTHSSPTKSSSNYEDNSNSSLCKRLKVV